MRRLAGIFCGVYNTINGRVRSNSYLDVFGNDTYGGYLFTYRESFDGIFGVAIRCHFDDVISVG